mmetsp:Transcript_25581/g.73889  ORF Transcript_25581/g.73889 Transcript_25581/m.73889 type:complete len:294 (+) Transcript_25581:105-986(+)
MGYPIEGDMWLIGKSEGQCLAKACDHPGFRGDVPGQHVCCIRQTRTACGQKKSPDATLLPAGVLLASGLRLRAAPPERKLSMAWADADSHAGVLDPVRHHHLLAPAVRGGAPALAHSQPRGYGDPRKGRLLDPEVAAVAVAVAAYRGRHVVGLPRRQHPGAPAAGVPREAAPAEAKGGADHLKVDVVALQLAAEPMLLPGRARLAGLSGELEARGPGIPLDAVPHKPQRLESRDREVEVRLGGEGNRLLAGAQLPAGHARLGAGRVAARPGRLRPQPDAHHHGALLGTLHRVF